MGGRSNPMIDGRIFAVYKGDQYLMDGTLQEIAAARGIALNSARFMTYPSYRRRIDERLKKNPNSKCVTLAYVSGRRKREWPKHK
jgi:hypothetical protein